MITIVPFLNKVNQFIINPIITLVFAISVIYFVYGVVKFISSEGKDKDQAKGAITWGLVGMFVMFSVYGILNILLNTFNIENPSYLENKL